MILDSILEFILSPLLALFDLLPEFNIDFNNFTYSNLAGWAQCLGYVCPVPLLIYMLTLKWSLRAFKIVMALIVRIKSFVPFWGA